VVLCALQTATPLTPRLGGERAEPSVGRSR